MFPQKFSLVDKIPASLDLEFSVLSHIYWDSEIFPKVFEILSSQDFFKPEHVKLFYAMEQCFLKDGIVSKQSVSDFLESNNLLEKVGGNDYISQLETRAPEFENTISFCKRIKTKSTRRKKLILAVEYISKIKEDTEDTENELNLILSKISKLNDEKPVTDIYEDLTTINKRTLNSIKQTKDESVLTGFYRIDEITGGFRPKSLNVIAAETSFGKTTLALNMFYNMGQNNHKVAYLTLEMTKEELALKINSRFTGLSFMQFQRRQLQHEDWQKLHEIHETRIKNTNLYISDAALDINEIVSTTRKLKETLGIEILFVDHLHYIKSKKYQDNKNLEISAYTHTLKELAKELNIAIVILSQVNRGNVMRADKRPNKSDLRDSGSIAQDCDSLAFIFRESSYNKDFPDPEQLEYIIRKNRGGETDIAIYLHFDGKSSTIIEKEMQPTKV